MMSNTSRRKTGNEKVKARPGKKSLLASSEVLRVVPKETPRSKRKINASVNRRSVSDNLAGTLDKREAQSYLPKEKVTVTKCPPGPESRDLEFQRCSYDPNLGSYQKALTTLPADFFNNYVGPAKSPAENLRRILRQFGVDELDDE